ncbi:MAG: TonB family protein [Candidatus Methylacidiphilales bacterium]
MSRLHKNLIWVAVAHVVVIVFLLFFHVPKKKVDSESAIQWVDLSTPRPVTQTDNRAPESIKEVTPPRPPDPTPVSPKPASVPTPKPEPLPAPQVTTQPTPKAPPQPKARPKPAPVEVDLTKVVKRTTTAPASEGNTNALTRRLEDSVGAVNLKSSAPSPAGGPIVNTYHAAIRDALYRAWERPETTPRPQDAHVEVVIMPDGSIQFVQITRPSGIAAMDDSVEQAARRAGNVGQPLPAGLGSPSYRVTIHFVLK